MKTCVCIVFDGLLKPSTHARAATWFKFSRHGTESVTLIWAADYFFECLESQVNLVPCHGSSRDVELAFIAFHN